MTNVDDLNELAKRRGFFFSANDSYGGLAGFYVYGPAGAALKNNIENSWRAKFVIGEGHFEISTPTISPSPVFKASGHLAEFEALNPPDISAPRLHKESLLNFQDYLLMHVENYRLVSPK